jgi:capsular polysaccharide transport system permease protein
MSAEPIRKADITPLKLAETVIASAEEPEQRERWKLRHKMLVLSFVLTVILPTGLGIAYLYTRAADQYYSSAAFSVRSEEFSSPIAALSVLTQIGTSSASDSAVLYDFIRAQPMVEKLDTELDFRTVFNRETEDVVFSLGPDPTIEDMVEYWEWIVDVSVDPTSGVVEVKAMAFRPEDSHRILQGILTASSSLVDDLSRIAREDTMKYALADLELAGGNLREMRRRIGEFRVANQMIDPSADANNQMGVISALQSELAKTLVDRAALISYTSQAAGNQRLAEIDRRIAAIKNQIEEERAAVSGAADGRIGLSKVIGEYEELLVDLEFSEDAYTAARAAEDQARAEARRKNRYLAVHIPPTMAQESLFPRRWLLSGLLFACCFAAWGVLALIYYNVRDRS